VAVILIDTGPLVALFDVSEQAHIRVARILAGLRRDDRLFTSLAVVTEVTHLLDFSVRKQVEFLHWVDKPAASGKLGYNERRELERLPARIEELEQRQRELHALTADPAFYKQEPAAITRRMEELRALEAELEAAYGRWEALEAREGAG
jgi:predicted nucleic acid-binding protein